MMTDPIRFTVDRGLARITLNRPQRLNAFNSDLAHAWVEATREATSRDDVGAILIDAEGRAFCAGGDVIEMAQSMSSGSDITALADVINKGIRALTESKIPVVAAAHGTTAGGGLGIMLCSDYAVVGSDSKLGSRYANVGLTPDLSVSAQLARAVGERRALQLVLQDRMLSAYEAESWGLVAEVVDQGESSDIASAVRFRAEEIAHSWLRGAFRAYGQAKHLIRSQPSRTFVEQLTAEAASIGTFFDTDDAKARVGAFASASTARG